MDATPLQMETSSTLAEEEILRARLYGLLARFFAAPPDIEVLAMAAELGGDETEFGQAVANFAELAGKVDVAAAAREYHDLFIGVGRGELLPYASYYLPGFLHEKPLAKLRQDMARLGIERAEDVKEPEDHLAAICEMMNGLILGEFGTPAPLAAQREFFDTHLLSWAGHFFEDLETAKNSALYAALGSVGRTFMAIETTAVEMED